MERIPEWVRPALWRELKEVLAVLGAGRRITALRSRTGAGFLELVQPLVHALGDSIGQIVEPGVARGAGSVLTWGGGQHSVRVRMRRFGFGHRPGRYGFSPH